MKKPKLESKRIFLIASEDDELISLCRAMIDRHISSSTLFTAGNGAETLFKLNNVTPHVAIVDARLSKVDGIEITDHILKMKGDDLISVISIGEIPKTEIYLEEVMTRQLQFLEDYKNETRFALYLSRALNRISIDENTTYGLRFLAADETLFRQGDAATGVYYVKRGELEVSQGVDEHAVVIGQVSKNEFVGEMAHFNGEPRSATVRALTDCELIEIPSSTLDLVLFSKPAWSKALIATLARRLKRSNDQVVKSSI